MSVVTAQETVEEELNAKQTARMLGVSLSTLWRRVKLARIPQPVRVNRRVLYWSRTAILEWLEKLTGRTEA